VRTNIRCQNKEKQGHAVQLTPRTIIFPLYRKKGFYFYAHEISPQVCNVTAVGRLCDRMLAFQEKVRLSELRE
jgi:hypothetical protein